MSARSRIDSSVTVVRAASTSFLLTAATSGSSATSWISIPGVRVAASAFR